jgi:exodeoxyribonuclease VII large subunit
MQIEETKIYTVDEFLTVTNEFLEGFECFVQGEVSELSIHQTGIYLTIKDKKQGSVLQCYIPPFSYRASGVNLEVGMEVKIGGWATIYKPKGRFSFLVRSLELAGEGTLKKAYELLKKKLELEGLMARKREIPKNIKRIAVVTSKTGAVISDFRNNLKKRGFCIDLWDVRVEGVHATNQVARAIHAVSQEAKNYEVLVVMRGGGSLEDLAAFNSEEVARAIFASRIPTICAIGHDRDIPIATLVADSAPSTPTAAAEIINRSWEVTEDDLSANTRKMIHLFEKALMRKSQEVANNTQQLSFSFQKIESFIENKKNRMAELFENRLTRLREKMEHTAMLLKAVDPKNILRKGYAIVWNEKKEMVKSIKDIHEKERVTINLADGSFTAQVNP